jgi:hypothetical protein
VSILARASDRFPKAQAWWKIGGAACLKCGALSDDEPVYESSPGGLEETLHCSACNFTWTNIFMLVDAAFEEDDDNGQRQ